MLTLVNEDGVRLRGRKSKSRRSWLTFFFFLKFTFGGILRCNGHRQEVNVLNLEVHRYFM